MAASEGDNDADPQPSWEDINYDEINVVQVSRNTDVEEGDGLIHGRIYGGGNHLGLPRITSF